MNGHRSKPERNEFGWFSTIRGENGQLLFVGDYASSREEADGYAKMRIRNRALMLDANFNAGKNKLERTKRAHRMKIAYAIIIGIAFGICATVGALLIKALAGRLALDLGYRHPAVTPPAQTLEE